MLECAFDQLIYFVLPAAAEYLAAEDALSEAYKNSPIESDWLDEARNAKRKAADLAIAIDSLTDRTHNELSRTKSTIRQEVAAFCVLPTSGSTRNDAMERVRGVANAYKHGDLSDPKLPIQSDNDVLVVGLGYGLDGYGVGKYSGVEVIIKEISGDQWKFIGDAVVTIAGWFRYLANEGAAIPSVTYEALNIQVYP